MIIEFETETLPKSLRIRPPIRALIDPHFQLTEGRLVGGARILPNPVSEAGRVVIEATMQSPAEIWPEDLRVTHAGNRMTRDHLLVESSDHGFGPDRCGGRIALRNGLTACRDCQQRKTGEPHWPGWLEDPHARLL